MSTITDLHAVRALLTPPGAWTQNADARAANVECVEARDEAAVCWCLRGALDVMGSGLGAVQLLNGFALANGFDGGSDDDPYVEWNDAPGRTQDEVLTMLDDVIAKESP